MNRDVFEVMNILKECAEKRFLAEIYYRKLGKNGGAVKRYLVEPYEIKKGFLFVHDVSDDSTKSLAMTNIEQIAMTSAPWVVPKEHIRAKFARKIIGELEVEEKVVKDGNDADNKE